MNVAVAAPTDDTLTALDKFRLFTKKDRCLVKILRPGKDPTWIGATILDANKGGAYCKADQGTERFFHWNEVKPSEETGKRRTLASIGEIVGNKLRQVPPYLDVAPEPQAPPPRPPAEPQSGVLLISRKELAAMGDSRVDDDEERDDGEPMRRRHNAHAHKLTPIGELFRRMRLEKGQSQISIAEILGTTNSRVSQIELGKSIPTEDELLAFAEAFRLEIDELLRLRDESINTRVDRRLKEHREVRDEPLRAAAPAPAPAPAREPDPAPAPPTTSSTTTLISTRSTSELSMPDPMRAVSDPEDAFAEFCLDLGQLAPVPRGDVEQRKLWFALARKLFQLKR